MINKLHQQDRHRRESLISLYRTIGTHFKRKNEFAGPRAGPRQATDDSAARRNSDLSATSDFSAFSIYFFVSGRHLSQLRMVSKQSRLELDNLHMALGSREARWRSE